MSPFQNPRLLKTRPEPLSWDARKYISPDGHWSVIFKEPFEWHMGADGWKLVLLNNELDVTRHHPELVRGVTGKGFRCPENLVPWSYNSHSLLLCTWEKEPIILYDILNRERRLSPVIGFPFSAQCDPAGENYLILFEDYAVVLNSSGDLQARVNWPVNKNHNPRSFWLGHGNIFFVVNVNPRTNKTEARIFTSNGELLEVMEIDPSIIVPFDRDKFTCINRDRYTLVINNSTKGVGSMLDTWHDIHFEQKNNSIQLAIHRPIGEPYKSEGTFLCNVEEVWIEMDLNTQP